MKHQYVIKHLQNCKFPAIAIFETFVRHDQFHHHDVINMCQCVVPNSYKTITYQEFHFNNVTSIMLYMSSTNSAIYNHLKAFLHMLYIVSYCTDNLSWENDVTISSCPIAGNPLEIKCIFNVRSFGMLCCVS